MQRFQDKFALTSSGSNGMGFATTPTKKSAKPAELANAVMFLAS